MRSVTIKTKVTLNACASRTGGNVSKELVADGLRKIGRPATAAEIGKVIGLSPISIGTVLDNNRMTFTTFERYNSGVGNKNLREFVTFHKHMLPHEIAAGFKGTP
jgi:hypothetical protein